jgi:hypothetical protein
LAAYKAGFSGGVRFGHNRSFAGSTDTDLTARTAKYFVYSTLDDRDAAIRPFRQFFATES